ncbi:hypothetical protein PHJA_002842500 [Phtheirospermum japonicum]|uniref:Uncharacterized protein n=1 Tax=Phtheirospermum japonicum TaxID=374723 RepID=A0A830DGK3_9LAMI|nr:hypothetical protein PHJA_002842500 [Phtheirospermum japonicum]
MASNCLLHMMIMWLIMCLTLVPSINGRTLSMKELQHKKNVPSPADSLYMAALPKGTVPASTPSKKGHAATTDQKLIARHLAAIDRILRSVPSPGVGH